MKSLIATACTLSLLLAADQAQAGPRVGFTGITTGTAKADPPRARPPHCLGRWHCSPYDPYQRPGPIIRDHRGGR